VPYKPVQLSVLLTTIADRCREAQHARSAPQLLARSATNGVASEPAIRTPLLRPLTPPLIEPGDPDVDPDSQG